MSAIWFNEIDYDQPGADTDSFIEFKGTGTVEFSGLRLMLVNGQGNTVYQTIDLSSVGVMAGSSWFVVVGNTTVTVPPGAAKINIDGDWLQNGAPDGVALVDVVSGTVLEYWSYEGSLTGTIFAGIPGTHNSVSIVPEDNGITPLSLTRTGATSWSSETTPTPGAVNAVDDYSAATMSFTSTAVSAVEKTGPATIIKFVVTRSVTAGPATVDWTIDAPGTPGHASAADFVATSGTLTFANGAATATIAIRIVGDNLVEADEAFSVLLSNATGGYAISTATASGVIRNDDAGNGDDTIWGNAYSNILDGRDGNDILSGGGGDDVLIGGFGIDKMTGGKGADTFDFNSIWETGTTASTRDIINGFSMAEGDLIDLSTIDADIFTAGDQAFTLLATGAAFTGVAGQLRIVEQGNKSIIAGDVNGDGIVDFSILVMGVTGLNSTAFIL